MAIIEWLAGDYWTTGYIDDRQVCRFEGSHGQFTLYANGKQTVFKSVAGLKEFAEDILVLPARTTPLIEKERNVMKELLDGFKKFITENRTIIYWLAVAFLADHFFFKGAFREKLHQLVTKIIGRVEKQIDNA